MAFTYKDYAESADVKKRREEADAHSQYKESQSVTDARLELDQHNQNKVDPWTGGSYGTQLKDSIDKINNREKFSYDLNADALYQQYKDKYINQGRLAMVDTVGQASAMTGGYGNSYAVTAGNQAYQSYLQNLNDVVPQLYQLAFDKYNQETQDMYNMYNLYNDAYGREYGEYRDKVSDWNDAYDRLSNRYYNESSLDYNRFSSDRDYYRQAYQDAYNQDYGQYSDAYGRAFASYQQQVAEDQFAKNLALEQAKFDFQKSQAKKSSGGSGGKRSSGGSSSKSSSSSGTDAVTYLGQINKTYGSAAANSEYVKLNNSGAFKGNEDLRVQAQLAARGGSLSKPR